MIYRSFGYLTSFLAALLLPLQYSLATQPTYAYVVAPQGANGHKVLVVNQPVYVPATIYVAQPSVNLQVIQNPGASTSTAPQVQKDLPPKVFGLSGSYTAVPSPEKDAISILRSECASCHTSPGKGRYDLFDAAGNIIGDPDEAYFAVKKGLMPPGRPLPDHQRLILRTWALNQPAH